MPVAPTPPRLLLQDGGFLLLEDGGAILLEQGASALRPFRVVPSAAISRPPQGVGVESFRVVPSAAIPRPPRFN